MPTINVENLVLNTQKKLALDPTDSNILNLSVALKQLRGSVIFSVQNFSDLPTAGAETLGKLYYVKRESSIYQVTFLDNTYFWKTIAQDFKSVLWTVGWNGNGLGGSTGTSTICFNTNYSSYIPISSINSACAVKAGRENLFIIDYNANAFGAGGNSQGILGVGGCIAFNNCFRKLPDSWLTIAPHYNFGAGITTDGILKTWGRNYYSNLGQSGVGNGQSVTFPANVTGTLRYIDVALFEHGGSAITDTGRIFSWGYNTQFALGIGNNDGLCYSSPVEVAGGGTNWCQIQSAYYGFNALKTDGCIWSWGPNSFGQHGDGTNSGRCSPVTALGNDGTWCTLASSTDNDNYTSAAIKTNGTLWMWGYGCHGLLGNGQCVSNFFSPIQTAVGGTNWCQVSVSRRNVTAVKTDGTLWTWGCNDQGQLGINICTATCAYRDQPTATCPSKTNWWRSASGFYNSYGLDRISACSI